MNANRLVTKALRQAYGYGFMAIDGDRALAAALDPLVAKSVAPLVAERDRLREALEKVSKTHHSDTCSWELVEGCECDCHRSIARAALAGEEASDG